MVEISLLNEDSFPSLKKVASSAKNDCLKILLSILRPGISGHVSIKLDISMHIRNKKRG